MNDFKERCTALRKQGKSIGEIVKITGRAKSSVYLHIKDIPLSEERRAMMRAAAAARIRKYPIARKGKSLRPHKKFTRWSPDTVMLLGHLLFDGELGRACVYNNRSDALIARVERLMKIVYDFPPKHWVNTETGVRRISYYNVELSLYLQNKAKELLRSIRQLPGKQKNALLQAFFDDEGCMDFRPDSGTRKIRGYQKDTKILELIHLLLSDFAIDSKIAEPNEVVIVGKENLKRFEKEINFSPGVCINGNRSNSRWKKHFEKRQLLRMAIESYQR